MRNAVVVHAVDPGSLSGMRLSFLANLADEGPKKEKEAPDYQKVFRMGWEYRYREVIGLRPSAVKAAVDSEWERFKSRGKDYWQPTAAWKKNMKAVGFDG